MVELHTILEGMTPNYFSELFVKADTRDKCKLIQSMERTNTYGLRSFQYYGAHAWNMLPVHMKATQSLNLNLSLSNGLGRHVHAITVIYLFLCHKKYHSHILITGTGCVVYVDSLVVSCGVVTVTTFLLFLVFRIHACHWDEGPGTKVLSFHYTDVIITTVASHITSLTVVYSIVYSGADERKHQSSASMAFVRGIHRDRWIPRTKGQ